MMGVRLKFGDFLFNNVFIMKYNSLCQGQNDRIIYKKHNVMMR